MDQHKVKTDLVEAIARRLFRHHLGTKQGEDRYWQNFTGDAEVALEVLAEHQ